MKPGDLYDVRTHRLYEKEKDDRETTKRGIFYVEFTYRSDPSVIGLFKSKYVLHSTTTTLSLLELEQYEGPVVAISSVSSDTNITVRGFRTGRLYIVRKIIDDVKF